MGVPVITLAGNHYVERLSATKLVSVGVPELISNNVGDYIDRAVSLAENQEAREMYHSSLRTKMATSPLCDSRSLAKALENAYRHMWHKHVSTGDG